MKDWKTKVLIPVLALLIVGVGSSCTTVDTEARPQSDEEIAKLAINRLADDLDTGRYTYSVVVENGIATVKGSVPNETFRARVIGIVRSTPGVRDVKDQLRVQRF